MPIHRHTRFVKKRTKTVPESKLQTLARNKSHLQYRLRGAIYLLEEIGRNHKGITVHRLQIGLEELSVYIDKVYQQQKAEIRGLKLKPFKE